MMKTGKKGFLSGLLLIGEVKMDPDGRRLPWPMPPIKFGNAAHLANLTSPQDPLRTSSSSP